MLAPMRRKVRWQLLSPEGEEERSGLSFGAFDERTAFAYASRVAATPTGYTLQVFLDGQLIDRQLSEPPSPAVS